MTLVPHSNATAEFVERKSRFIGHVFRVADENSARDALEKVRCAHREASHNVYAYKLQSGTARFSDDGEPSGTAGRPVMEVFTREGIVDYCCVVTRYFGGTLLGAGGLVRAYAHAAKIALDAARVAALHPMQIAEVTVEYPLYERVCIIIEALNGAVEDTKFTDTVALRFVLPSDAYAEVCEHIRELSSGAVTVEAAGERFVPVLVR